MIEAPFIYADGRRELREVIPGREVWVTEDRARLFPARIGEAWATNPPVLPRATRHYFRRERWVYSPDWQGPLEPGWFWDQGTDPAWREQLVWREIT